MDDRKRNQDGTLVAHKITFEVDLRYDPPPEDEDPDPEEFDIEEAIRRYFSTKIGLVAPDEITARRK